MDEFERLAKRIKTIRAKYAPIIPRLDDVEFATLYEMMVNERDERHARLIVTNPIYQRLVVQRLQDRQDG